MLLLPVFIGNSAIAIPIYQINDAYHENNDSDNSANEIIQVNSPATAHDVQNLELVNSVAVTNQINQLETADPLPDSISGNPVSSEINGQDEVGNKNLDIEALNPSTRAEYQIDENFGPNVYRPVN